MSPLAMMGKRVCSAKPGMGGQVDRTSIYRTVCATRERWADGPQNDYAHPRLISRADPMLVQYWHYYDFARKEEWKRAGLGGAGAEGEVIE